MDDTLDWEFRVKLPPKKVTEMIVMLPETLEKLKQKVRENEKQIAKLEGLLIRVLGLRRASGGGVCAKCSMKVKPDCESCQLRYDIKEALKEADN